MKKTALISGIVFVLFLFISHGLQAKGFYRYGPGIENDHYDLDLTLEQMEKIDILELELEKELVPLIAKLRSNYLVFDELETQRNPDPTRINNVWDVIYRLEEDIQNKEILHENKIRDLLTEEQKAVFNSYYAYGTNLYGRGGFSRGYFGRRAGQLGYCNSCFLRGVRYYRRPCGVGLGRWCRWNDNRVEWNWKR